MRLRYWALPPSLLSPILRNSLYTRYEERGTVPWGYVPVCEDLTVGHPKPSPCVPIGSGLRPILYYQS